MRIIATYANRSHNPDIVELVCAWDEFSVDDNYDGWLADKTEALKSWGDDLLRHVDVEIDVDMTDVYAHLLPDLKTTADSVRLCDADEVSA